MTPNLPTRRFTRRQVDNMARQLAELLIQAFKHSDNQGGAFGIFPVVGRGDSSLEDSCRQAEPSDDIRHYHNILNARQPRHGPFYVHTRANRYVRRGMVVPDITGHAQPGSALALYEREDLASSTTELLVRVVLQLGHSSGLILPGKEQTPQVVIPESSTGAILEQLETSRQTAAGYQLPQSMRLLAEMSPKLEFAVIVSDFLNDGWQTALLDISRYLEVVVFQIVDPTDIELPDVGKKRIQHHGRIKKVDTSNPRVRENYRQAAAKQQEEIAETIRRARAQHFRLETTLPIFDQLLSAALANSGWHRQIA